MLDRLQQPGRRPTALLFVVLSPVAASTHDHQDFRLIAQVMRLEPYKDITL
ncbi:MAG: hypothetical protein J2P36_10500 [Ktedonobacteraceae bacterium]|nr:hypothetical protein [Ktedonobacteraceae bacterium]